MSKEYLNVVSPRNVKDGKTEWHRVGVAFRNDNKPDIPYTIVFSSQPMPEINEKGKLECKVLLMKPKDFKQNNNTPPQPQPSQNNYGPSIDDEVTF